MRGALVRAEQPPTPDVSAGTRPPFTGTRNCRVCTDEQRHLSVLVVDDEPSGLEALARLLTWDGHQVHRAGTVADALELAERVRFDLLIGSEPPRRRPEALYGSR